MGRALFLEAAQEADLDPLLSLERRCYTHPWNLRHFRQAMREPERGLILLLRAPSSAADSEAGLRAYCAFESVVEEMHIHNLAVHPEHRGRGLGQLLLRLALGIGARRGAQTAFLEVRESNGPALGLYRGAGFEVAATRRDYYVQPREDALVLRKRGLTGGRLNP